MSIPLIKRDLITNPRIEISTEALNDQEFSKELVSIADHITKERKHWNFKLSPHRLLIYNDIEKIGNISVSEAYKRRVGRVNEYSVAFHSGKNDTESPEQAAHLAINNCRNKRPSEWVSERIHVFNSAAIRRQTECENLLQDHLRGHNTMFMEMASEYHKHRLLTVPREFELFSKKLAELKQEAETATESNNKVGQAKLILKRSATWLVMDSNGHATYDRFEDIPVEYSRKLATLQILDTEETYVCNAGMRLNSRLFWVIP